MNIYEYILYKCHENPLDNWRYSLSGVFEHMVPMIWKVSPNKIIQHGYIAYKRYDNSMVSEAHTIEICKYISTPASIEKQIGFKLVGIYFSIFFGMIIHMYIYYIYSFT